MKTYLEPFDVVFEITLDLRVVIVVVVFFNGSRYISYPLNLILKLLGFTVSI